MRIDKIAVAAILAVVLCMASPVQAAAQDTATTPRRGTPGKAFITPGDPRLLTPEMLTPDVSPQMFVNSYLVSLFTMDPGVVYDAYLHPELMAALSREVFVNRVVELKELVGPLMRVGLTYLREEHRAYEGMDGGWTEHRLSFEGDPRVQARVEFKRVADGKWKVFHSAIRSPQLDRLQRAREAAREAAAAAAGDTPDEGDGDREPDSPEERR